MFSGILLVIVILLLLAAMPAWPYSWGWGPSGLLGFLLLVLVIALILGAI
jgi:hypothetical protein